MSKDACQPDQRLSQDTLLTFLAGKTNDGKIYNKGRHPGEPATPTPVEKFSTSYKTNEHPQYELLNNLPRENWVITSFNPRNRQVCVELNSKGIIRVLSFVLNVDN